jgi:hypothetical protein
VAALAATAACDAPESSAVLVTLTRVGETHASSGVQYALVAPVSDADE